MSFMLPSLYQLTPPGQQPRRASGASPTQAPGSGAALSAATGGSAVYDAHRQSKSSDGSSLVKVPSQPSGTGTNTTISPSPSMDFDKITPPSPRSPMIAHTPSLSASVLSASGRGRTSSNAGKARLLLCKSHVSIHPTAFSKDNISGYLGLVEVDKDAGFDGTEMSKGKELLITWVPNELLDRMDEKDREGYRRIDGRTPSLTSRMDKEEDGFVFVSLPPPKGEKYAFSVPVSQIYSVLVYAPSLSHWYGSATFNLSGGVSLPTLFFHDDEAPLLATSSSAKLDPPKTPNPRSQWGFPPFLNLLQRRAVLLRSRLLTPRQNQGAELWLVNPSKGDREVHEAGIDLSPPPAATAERRESQAPTSMHPFPPKAQFPSSVPSLFPDANPRQSLLTSLSAVTNFTRKAANQVAGQVLSHPLAQPVVPHLPPAVRSLANAHGEIDRPAKKGKGEDVASEFEAARLYLARWARVVAEEGERARRSEIAAQANFSAGERVGAEDLASSLGVFSLLTSPNSKRPIPHPTRSPDHPITSQDWTSFAAQGRDEGYIRHEIFRRGFSDSTEPEEMQTRREGWEVLLGVVEWNVGGVGGGSLGKERRKEGRDAERQSKREEYEKLKNQWQSENREAQRDAWKEEWHRIDVDCRRTDRNQPMFAVPTEAIVKGDEEKEAGGAGGGWEKKAEAEEGGAARLNPHIAALRTILMTYHTYNPALGYVQGMSDLLAPIYVVFGANEANAFWGLVGVMKIMESNFLRDQSGMKRQLSTLQQLIGVMDPELYSHLERTDSLNLFFCFRWILISFKREFKFENVIKLWEVLWTNYYSNQFVLFVALAILQSHRDMILRYLTEFDEVLKYANDLAGSIDLDTTLAQAEVLFLSFRGLLQDLDRKLALEEEAAGGATGGSGLRKRRGSGVSVRSENGKIGRDVSELRDLLVAWPEETPTRHTEGQYDIRVRRISTASGWNGSGSEASTSRRGSLAPGGPAHDFRSGVWAGGSTTPSANASPTATTTGGAGSPLLGGAPRLGGEPGTGSRRGSLLEGLMQGLAMPSNPAH